MITTKRLTKAIQECLDPTQVVTPWNITKDGDLIFVFLGTVESPKGPMNVRIQIEHTMPYEN